MSRFALMFVFCVVLGGSSLCRADVDPTETPRTGGDGGPPSRDHRNAETSDRNNRTGPAEQLAAVEQAVERVERAVVEDRADAAALRSGKLIASGVTAGVSLALQVGTGSLGDAAIQRSAALVAMPYIMFLPGYWGLTEEARRYCAAHWTGGEDSQATDAAMVIAKRKAKQVVAAMRADLQMGFSRSMVRSKYDVEEEHVTAAGAINALRDPEQQRNKESALIDSVANHIWNVRHPGACGLTKFGVWLGKPLSYDSTVAFDTDVRTATTIDPVIAFGLGFNINAYVVVMAGMTLSRVSRDMRPPENLMSLTFAVGGNLDLVGALLK